jgi:hypothetical protein
MPAGCVFESEGLAASSPRHDDLDDGFSSPAQGRSNRKNRETTFFNQKKRHLIDFNKKTWIPPGG